jgi:SAM-dependent methyltransferase
MERGSDVLGVEPDVRMAEVARRHGLDVEVSPFETWDDAGRRFDVVVAGQAWHWIDPVAGTRKAADVLRPGGRIALFWNMGKYEPDVVAALQPVYDEHFPEAESLGTYHAHHDDLPGLVGDDRFGPVEAWTHAWDQHHSTAEWIDQLATHSNHRLLPDDRRARLFDGIAAAVDGITVHYETVVVTAVRGDQR